QGRGPSLQSMLRPALALGMALAAVVMRQLRSALLEVLQQDYVRVARAKGLREALVVGRHALKNALIPVVTVIGLQTGRLFGGAVVVETIFALPGLGRLAADSIFFRDFPLLQGVVLILALAVLSANLLTDVLYSFLDPRIRYRIPTNVEGRIGSVLTRALQTRGAGFGLVVVALVLVVALAADVIAPYNPNQAQPAGVLTAPALAHWLGTDQLGRDVLSRIIHGTRTSVQAGVV